MNMSPSKTTNNVYLVESIVLVDFGLCMGFVDNNNIDYHQLYPLKTGHCYSRGKSLSISNIIEQGIPTGLLL